VVSAASATGLWLRAEVERRRADRERAEAVAARERKERVAGFLGDLFRAVDPDHGSGHRVTAAELLGIGRERLAGGLDDDPALVAELAATLGNAYRNLGLYDEALELLDRSAGLHRELGRQEEARLVVLSDLASVHYYRGSHGEASRLFREVLELRRGRSDPEQTALAAGNLASALKQLGRFDEAGELYREALVLREAARGPADLRVASSLYALGSLLYEQGELEASLEPLRRALQIRATKLGEHHIRVATVLGTLGRALHAMGELEQAEPFLRRALSTRRQLLGEAHAHVALSRRDLGALLLDRGALLLDRGALVEAGTLLDQALGSLRRSQSPDAWTIASAMSLWGAYLAATGRSEAASPYLERGYHQLRETKGEASIYTRQAEARLAALDTDP
ncbi:MAG: tetratricopeptide repeat protein, partial [Holophagales bacterium]|nr:tetratricopeptide repeat protein [Holophagales bacterium]